MNFLLFQQNHNFESIVVFNIDKSKTNKNYNLSNKGQHHSIEDLGPKANEIFLRKIIGVNKNMSIFRLKKLKKFIKSYINDNYIKKFFK